MGRTVLVPSSTQYLVPSTQYRVHEGPLRRPFFLQKEASVSSRVEALQRPGTQPLVSQGPDGSTRFDLVVIPDRFKGPMDDIRRRIGGLSRVRSVHLDPAKSRFTIIVGAGGAEARRVIGEVCAMGCIVRLVASPTALAA